MGLLSKVSNLDLSEKLTFSDFVISNSIKTCAILDKLNNYFSIQNSIGFDSNSIISSHSTNDFWDGICSKRNSIYTFSKNDNSINCLLQLFSFQMKESINSLSIYRTNDLIFLLINQEITSKIISDLLIIENIYPTFCKLNFNTLINSKNAYKFEISFEMLLNSYKNNELSSILNELTNRFLCFYSNLNQCTRISQDKIRLFFIENDSFNEKVFIKNIKLNLSEVIDNQIESIKVSFKGKTNNCDEIISFMKNIE